MTCLHGDITLLSGVVTGLYGGADDLACIGEEPRYVYYNGEACLITKMVKKTCRLGVVKPVFE